MWVNLMLQKNVLPIFSTTSSLTTLFGFKSKESLGPLSFPFLEHQTNVQPWFGRWIFWSLLEHDRRVNTGYLVEQEQVLWGSTLSQRQTGKMCFHAVVMSSPCGTIFICEIYASECFITHKCSHHSITGRQSDYVFLSLLLNLCYLL